MRVFVSAYNGVVPLLNKSYTHLPSWRVSGVSSLEADLFCTSSYVVVDGYEIIIILKIVGFFGWYSGRLSAAAAHFVYIGTPVISLKYSGK